MPVRVHQILGTQRPALSDRINALVLAAGAAAQAAVGGVARVASVTSEAAAKVHWLVGQLTLRASMAILAFDPPPPEAP